MNEGGFIYWEPPFGHQGLPNDGAIYLDGHWFQDWPEVGTTVFGMIPSQGLILLETLAQTHIPQRHYRGARAPLKGDKLDFSCGFLVDGLEDYKFLARAVSRARPLYFCPGVWCGETFPAVAGSTYTLSRPLATGIVPGVSEVTHPTSLYLGDGEDANPAAATVVGQTVSALLTGELFVWYMPVFRVAISWSQEVPDVNDLRVALTLSEAVIASF